MAMSLQLHTLVDVSPGTKLSVTIWSPDTAAGSLPTVLVMTPYNADEEQSRASKYIKNGYVYVAADVRGRGLSDGSFQPFFGDGADACAIVRWIRTQPWSNGMVAMRGGSYRGTVQWQAAKHCNRELATILPTASAYPGYDFPHLKGILPTPYNVRWLALVDGKTRNTNLFADDDYWRDVFLKLYANHIPFHRLDDLAGVSNPVFDQWLSHVADSQFWSSAQLQREHYSEISIPILTITGQFDGDQPGALRFYEEHMKYGSAVGTKSHFLVIGPWDHAETRYPKTDIAGLTFSEESLLDIDALQIQWLDWILKQKNRPAFLKDRVAYYVIGEEKWQYASEFADIANGRLTFYLAAGKGSTPSVFASGDLNEDVTQSEGDTSTFVSDPNIVTPWVDMDTADFTSAYLTDASPAYDPNALVFHSEPFESDRIIVGRLKLSLYVSMNAPDADIRAYLYAVRPNGGVVELGEDFVRARFRNGLRAKNVQSGDVNLFGFDGFLWHAEKLPRGTRLRLVILPFNTPFIQKNYNTGGRIGHEHVRDARVAVINVHHDTTYRSRLEVPVLLRYE
jgi:putative CocE/NonD family hydrolase